MDPVVMTYGAYLGSSLALTAWVGRTLHRNGRAFLVGVFDGDSALADSLNHLLLVGFYLVNLGFVVEHLRTPGSVETLRTAVELLADKVGTVAVVLGGMHFMNLFIFGRLWRRSALQAPEIPHRLFTSGAADGGQTSVAVRG